MFIFLCKSEYVEQEGEELQKFEYLENQIALLVK